MLSQLAATSAAQAFAALREPLARELASEIAPHCARVVAGRYPLVRDAREEVSRDEFARQFGAGGVIDASSSATWRPTSTPRPGLGPIAGRRRGAMAPDALLPFQHAQAIREAYFRNARRNLGVSLEFRPLAMDDDIAEFKLDIDGQMLRFRAGAQGVQSLLWPGYECQRPGPPADPCRRAEAAGRASNSRARGRCSGCSRGAHRIRLHAGAFGAGVRRRGPQGAHRGAAAWRSIRSASGPGRRWSSSNAPRTTLNRAAVPGWYGKLPHTWATSRRVRLPASFVRPWDRWLQNAAGRGARRARRALARRLSGGTDPALLARAGRARRAGLGRPADGPVSTASAATSR
jgi:hypothetical protein